MLSVVISALVTGIFYAFLFVVASFLFCALVAGIIAAVEAVTEWIRMIRTIILSGNDLRALIKEIRRTNPKVADKLLEMLDAKQKVVVIQDHKGYQCVKLRARDSSQDEVRHGAVVFNNGEACVYDKYGDEHRRHFNINNLH